VNQCAKGKIRVWGQGDREGSGGSFALQAKQLLSGGMESDVGAGGVLPQPRGWVAVVGRPGLELASLLGPHGMLPPTISGDWPMLGSPGSPYILGIWYAIG